MSHDAELTLLPVAEIFAGPTVIVPADGRRPGRRRSGCGFGGPVGTAAAGRARDRAQGPGPAGGGHGAVELAHLDCAPLSARLDGAILLSKLQSRLGEHPARATGDGGEFDGVREFVPGDRQRRINWAATTRRGTLHLTTFAAERTQNVVVIADVTFDIGAPGMSTHDLALRGAAGRHQPLHREPGPDRPGQLRQRRRLGRAGPGPAAPGTADGAARQRLRPARRPDTLARLPRAALPPGSLIVAFSPLLDPRFIEAVA